MDNILSIEKLLSGVEIINMSKGTNLQRNVELKLKDQSTDQNSLLFLTENASGESETFDAATKDTPYAIIANEKSKILNCRSKIIRVHNVREAFAFACSNLYKIDYNRIKVVGITGTNGKTTTATLIYRILFECGYKVGFIGTGKILINDERITDENYSMTTPDPTLLYECIFKMIAAGCEYIIMEVSSHSIAQKKIAPIKFVYGIFTNLSSEHIDFHKEINNYYKTKLSMFLSVKHGLFNMDDKYSRLAHKEAKCKKSSFGILYGGDAYATDISLKGESGSEFFYRAKELIFKVKTPLCGAFNVYNCLAALKCVIDLGIKPCIAKEVISNIGTIEGRMEVIKSDITVIIDYAHTPEAFYNCIKTANLIKNPKQKLNVVFGCGGNRDKHKRSVMGNIASKMADVITLTEDNNRDEDLHNIISDIVEGIGNKDYVVIEDRETAIRNSIHSAAPGDVVAIVGKGHEKYKITRGDIIPFNEFDVVKSALNERDSKHES